MATVNACDWCGKMIEAEPDLWDKQGQPIWITWAAYQQRLVLCSVCQDTPIKLNDLRSRGQRHLQGSMPASENLSYMPAFLEAKENPPHEGAGG